MSDQGKRTDIRSDEMLERLLKKAGPRPVPSHEDAAAVRRAVRAEWQHLTGRRRRQVRVVQYALAATLLLGVVAIFNMLRVPVADAVTVASIDKSFGAIYLLGDSAELHETTGIESVYSGQTIVTGDDAGLSLAWGRGGSLRVDGNSRIEFTDESSIFVRSGRVYFDSTPSSLISAGANGNLVIDTEHGTVRHLGTQFMTRIESDELVVLVREGQVKIEGAYHDYTASPGEQVTFAGRQRPTALAIGSSGEVWDWVARTSPPVDVNGKSIRVFLDWASRELGLRLEFEGTAESVADQFMLVGSVDTGPTDALRLRLATAALSYRIEGDVLYVSDTEF